MRVTKSDLIQKVELARRVTGVPVIIEWAYGRPKLYVEEGPGYRDLSPRLPMPQLWDWLDAWLEGWIMAKASKRRR